MKMRGSLKLAIRTMIKKLRQSLPKNSIENVYGEGYKLTTQ
ncbi:MAG: hypothetical protein U9N59_08365 [Campylobacterota bacterium]|nr:hypothetical protein [Campylobacterota bacterium]